MIDRSADPRQPQRHVNAVPEAFAFQYRQPLIMVHTENCVVVPFVLAYENGVRRPGPGDGKTFLLRAADGRGDDVNLFAAHVPGFACVGV